MFQLTNLNDFVSEVTKRGYLFNMRTEENGQVEVWFYPKSWGETHLVPCPYQQRGNSIEETLLKFTFLESI